MRMRHLYCLAVQAGFYSSVIECWPDTQAARFDSSSDNGAKSYLDTLTGGKIDLFELRTNIVRG